jgi:hypothetical protein
MKSHCKFSFLIFFSLVMLMSCSKITPAGFWRSYQREYKESQNFDFGLWGGYLKIEWKSDADDTFDKKDILSYAANNGWNLTDSLFFATDTLSNDYGDDYSYKILSRVVFYDFYPFHLKLDLQGEYEIFVFESGWISVEAGFGTETEKNGFIFLSMDRKNLFVYHRWGEG